MGIIYKEILSNYQFKSNKALEYGFILKDNRYEYLTQLNIDELELLIIYDNEKLEAKVFDNQLDQELFLVYQTISIGEYTSSIIKLVNEEIDRVINNCFEEFNIQKFLFDYILEKYNVRPETPWEDHLNYHTFKTLNKNKWFALFLYIPLASLKIDSNVYCYILNLKIDYLKYPNIIDNKHFFLGYHMNKKYWISIVLNSGLDFELVKELIDNSYNLVEGL